MQDVVMGGIGNLIPALEAEKYTTWLFLYFLDT